MRQSKTKSDILKACMKFDRESAGKKLDYEKINVEFTTSIIQIIMHLKAVSKNDNILSELTIQLLDICIEIQNRLGKLSGVKK